MPTIPVNTLSAKYEVTAGRGLLTGLHRRVGRVFGGPAGRARRMFVLTSPGIWALWSERFLASFPKDTPPTVLFLPAGEPHKRLGAIERLAEEMAHAGADRSSVLVAFGGGIVGDAGGFLAAIYMRGIDYIQMPSTFLSQVDSSVGGKTGVNLAAGKNLVGCFYHPRAVFADTDLLGTLPARELRAGLFESIKAGIIRDAKLFTYMERNADAILNPAADGHGKALEHVIAASVRMKAEVVAIDEREQGLRMVLNLGHTLGHAIESATKYRKLLHGEAVGWGMLAATNLGALRGTVTAAQAGRIEGLIHRYGPLPGFKLAASMKDSVEKLLEAAGRDKKNRAGVRRFVLPLGIGDAVVVDNVTDTELYETAAWLLAAAKGVS